MNEAGQVFTFDGRKWTTGERNFPQFSALSDWRDLITLVHDGSPSINGFTLPGAVADEDFEPFLRNLAANERAMAIFRQALKQPKVRNGPLVDQVQLYVEQVTEAWLNRGRAEARAERADDSARGHARWEADRCGRVLKMRRDWLEAALVALPAEVQHRQRLRVTQVTIDNEDAERLLLESLILEDEATELEPRDDDNNDEL